MKETRTIETSNQQSQEPLYVYQFVDNSGFVFQVSAHNRAEAAKLAREQM